MKAAGDGSGLRRPLKTDVVVIGGGATGAGVARDLALRGLKVILVERRDLAAGATGRCHGLLHSGVRYSVKDLPAAMECILENRVLKEVAPQAIEDTGGFMVFLKGDDPRYLERWLANTQQAGIGCEEIPPGRALELEPNLSLDAERVSPDFVVSECEGCRMQIEHGSSLAAVHPIEILARALSISVSSPPSSASKAP
jgi:glycerol-3-phosphate dehydrogenase